MLNMTKIAICIAIVLGGASTSFAKSYNPRRGDPPAATMTNPFRTFGQTRIADPGRCWVPTPDQNSDEYGADTRGLGYWGSCSEKGAVPTK